MIEIIEIFVCACAVLYYMFCIAFMIMLVDEDEHDCLLKRVFHFVFIAVMAPLATPVLLALKLAEESDELFIAQNTFKEFSDIRYELDVLQQKLESIEDIIIEVGEDTDQIKKYLTQ